MAEKCGVRRGCSAAVHTPAELAIASGGQYWPVDLHAAQLRKLDTIIARAGITKDHHVLEIGCGWGAFAIRAAQTTGALLCVPRCCGGGG